jgi:hypothetical protein
MSWQLPFTWVSAGTPGDLRFYRFSADSCVKCRLFILSQARFSAGLRQHTQGQTNVHALRGSVAYPGIFFRGGESTNSVVDRGQKERGSGGGSSLVRDSSQFSNEWNPDSYSVVTDAFSAGLCRNFGIRYATSSEIRTHIPVLAIVLWSTVQNDFDIGSGLVGGTQTVKCLWPGTSVFSLKIH